MKRQMQPHLAIISSEQLHRISSSASTRCSALTQAFAAAAAPARRPLPSCSYRQKPNGAQGGAVHSVIPECLSGSLHLAPVAPVLVPTLGMPLSELSHTLQHLWRPQGSWVRARARIRVRVSAFPA